MSKELLRRICIVTGTRAEFGLLMPLMHEISNDRDLQLQVIVTGMHLSPEFGLTYKEVEKKFKIDKKIEMLLSSDTAIGTSKSMGLAQIAFAEAYNELQPDIVVLLGDRYEIFSAASAAMISRIPIAHISGGELTLGVVDDSIRHAITKMSHIHFTATEEYRARVIQLGESPDRVFNFGEVGLENVFKLDLMSKEDFEKSIDFSLNKKNILFTYHPTTLDDESKIVNDIDSILSVLQELNDTSIIFTKANSDSGGRLINQKVEEFSKNQGNTKVFTSLGQLRYLSALQFVDAVVGNSSSGIVEAPSFKIGTINIGNRQEGRLKPQSVIDCLPTASSLHQAFDKLYSNHFQLSLRTIENPYYCANSASKTKNVLKNIDLDKIIYKKFQDMK